MESRRLGGGSLTGTAAILAAAYGNSTFNLKNLWSELVGDCLAASVSFSLPITVYTRTSPLVLRLGDQVTLLAIVVMVFFDTTKFRYCGWLIVAYS